MIAKRHWTALENAHRELASRLQKLRKVRAGGDERGIKHAEMDYLHALQILYTSVQDAVQDPNCDTYDG